MKIRRPILSLVSDAARDNRGMQYEDHELVDIWRRIIVGDEKSWVLFRHGTCVVVTRHVKDVADRAGLLLAEWGAVGTTNPTADYRAVKLTKDPGWVVACRHPDILTYIGPRDLPAEQLSEESIGLLGRGRRYADAAELQVIHVEEHLPAEKQ